MPTAAYFVTVCLEGSIPARGLLDLQSYRAELEQRPRPADQTPAEWAIVQWKRAFARTDLWLDRAEAVRFLENDALAQIVVDALYCFAGVRYDLLGYVVMPSHFHWVFQPLEQWVNGLKPGKCLRTPRERIAQELAAVSFKEYGLQDANTLEATQTMVESGVVNEFLLCDQEVLIRHLHKETAAWVDDYQRKTVEV